MIFYTLDSTLWMKKLFLNGNKLLNLNDCLRCLEHNKLEVIGNQIQFLTETDFMSVSIAWILVLRENQIRWIDTNTFKSFTASLQLLDLSFNNITSVNGSVKYLSKLSKLYLSHNSIQVIFLHITFYSI